MFGEDDSESPRVPSPWDSLISTPATPLAAASPSPKSHSPSPLSAPTTVIPKLVPESDDGNVEYKLQLLNTSDARFTRLVTQMKWRLLEGGGQAYYELGVADSGALVGLPRAELEASLETLEMMAGEIGASVIVVKEIEVPAALVDLTVVTDDHRRVKKSDEFLIGSLDSDRLGSSEASTTEAETSATEDDFSESREDDGLGVFSMDSVDDPPVSIDIEISAVYKPRPVRTRVFKKGPSDLDRHRKGPKSKKGDKRHGRDGEKAPSRREARDKRREEKRKALEAFATGNIQNLTDQHKEDETVFANAVVSSVDPTSQQTVDTLAYRLDGLHVAVDDHSTAFLPTDDTIPALTLTAAEPSVDEGDDDVFPTTTDFPTLLSDSVATLRGEKPPRLIVEALVVRKMSLEEGFLDFGGFALA